MSPKQIKKALENVCSELNGELKPSDLDNNIILLNRIQMVLSRIAGIIDMIETKQEGKD